MKYKIVVDSCGEFTDEMKKDQRFESVPLSIDVDDYHIIDDKDFNQAEFLKKVKESPNCPKSSCPSPERYRAAFACGADHVYAVTLSAELSGSYNSAELGKKLFLEEMPDAKVHVFNSRSASIGQTLIALKIQEYEEAGLEFNDLVQKVEAYIQSVSTFFVLETLETLRKNGRLSNVKAFIASALNIKPVMGSTKEGSICQLDQARGMGRSIKKMVKYIVEAATESNHDVLAISHCNCAMRASMVKDELMECGIFKKIIILDTAGISSMYANDGGIIVAV